MRTPLLFTSAFWILLLSALSLPLRADEASCRDYCDREPECDECFKGGCDWGYDRLEVFRRGRNWSACRLNANGRDCRDWCREFGCDRCSTLRYCGSGFDALAHFDDHSGPNWHACAERLSPEEASARNQERCEDWCFSDEAPNCFRCSEHSGCGVGYLHLRTFGSRQRWYGCRVNGHGRECLDYCDEEILCASCERSRYDCDDGVVMRIFGRIGRWYACSRE